MGNIQQFVQILSNQICSLKNHHTNTKYLLKTALTTFYIYIIAEDIDEESFLQLTNDDLSELDFKIGPRKKLQGMIKKLKSEAYEETQENTSENEATAKTSGQLPMVENYSNTLVNDENLPIYQNQLAQKSPSSTSPKWNKVCYKN